MVYLQGKPERSCLVDCMRKPKKFSSSLNHRWFYSYGKPLKFLSRGLYEKTRKGFIPKPLKLSVGTIMISHYLCVFFTFVTSQLFAKAYIIVVINIYVRDKVLNIYIYMYPTFCRQTLHNLHGQIRFLFLMAILNLSVLSMLRFSSHNYCPLARMCCSRSLNTKINWLHERCLR